MLHIAQIAELTARYLELQKTMNGSLLAFDAMKEAIALREEAASPKADEYELDRFEEEATLAWHRQYGEIMTANGEAEIALLVEKFGLLQKEKDLKEEMLVTNEQMAQAMTAGIMDVIKGAKSMEEAFVGIVLQLVEMIIQAVIYKMIMGAMGGILPGGGIGAARQGMVLYGGDMQNFATGGVVSRPTMFPMANGGVGLMGEAGAEAIMPLTRMPSGDLGVKAQGGGGKNVIVNMNITTQDADSFRKSKKQIARDMGRGIKGAEM